MKKWYPLEESCDLCLRRTFSISHQNLKVDSQGFVWVFDVSFIDSTHSTINLNTHWTHFEMFISKFAGLQNVTAPEVQPRVIWCRQTSSRTRLSRFSAELSAARCLSSTSARRSPVRATGRFATHFLTISSTRTTRITNATVKRTAAWSEGSAICRRAITVSNSV